MVTKRQNCKTLLAKLQIVFITLGLFAIIAATFISITVIQDINNGINSANNSISKMRDGRIGAYIIMLNYGKDFLFRRIEIMERNVLEGKGGQNKIVKDLEERIFRTTAKMAKQWSAWYGGDQSESLAETTENKLKTIWDSPGLDNWTKIEQAESVWHSSIAEAGKRLDQAQKELAAKIDERDKLSIKYQNYNTIFTVLQFGGLVFIALSGLIEGIIVMKY